MNSTVPAGAALVVDCDVALEIACHEALIRQAYRDSEGVWTWCVGMTDATGHHVERYIDNPQPVDFCMRIYVWALNNYADRVRKAFEGCALTKAQLAAALSFDWNTGAIDRASWVRHFRAGNIAAARKAIMNWTTPKSLTDRRKAERALFFNGVWANDGTMIEYTRLTAAHAPVWSSARKIDVRAALEAAFAKPVTPVLDAAPKPDNRLAAPTLTPSKDETDAAPEPARQDPAPGAAVQPVPGAGKSGKGAGIAAAAMAVLAGVAAGWDHLTAWIGSLF